MSISRLYLDVIVGMEGFKDDIKFINNLMILAREMEEVKWIAPPNSVKWNKYIIRDGKKAIDTHIGVCFEQAAALAHIWKNEIKSEHKKEIKENENKKEDLIINKEDEIITIKK